MELPFKQQLILALVDKGALVVATVAGGLTVTRALERYRAHQTLQQAVAPERIRRISDVHQNVDDAARRLNLLISGLLVEMEALEGETETKWKGALSRHAEEVHELNTQALGLIDQVDREAFWMDRDSLQLLSHRAGVLLIGSVTSVIRAAVVQGGLRKEPIVEDYTRFVQRAYASLLNESDTRWERLLRRLKVRRIPRGPRNIDELLRRLAN